MQHSFDIEIAKQYGIEEAVILNNIYYWIEKNRANGQHFYDGYYWTYNSVKAFNELFPYMSAKKIRNALKHLIDEEILITGNYNERAYDRTLWYALTEKGKSICLNGQMDFPKRANGSVQKGEPIPYINTYINTDNNIYSPAQNIESEDIPYSEIVDYLNRVCGTAYRASTKKTKSLIKARWNEGFRVDDFKKVIDNKASQWLNDPAFSEYLRPETLFGTKFESYLNQKKVVRKTNIETNQNFGDELTRSQDDLCRMIGFNV